MSVVTIGESLGLLVASRLGRLELVPSMDLGFGGAESNVAIGLARLGVPATWMGRVGNDALGRLIERQLRAEGVTAALTRDADAPTGLMLKERPTAGSSAISYYRTASAGSFLAPEQLDLNLIREARILHITGITAALGAGPRAALDAAIDAATASGTLVSFDVNHRSRLWDSETAAAAYRQIASRADIVFAGDDEAELLTGERGHSAQAKAITLLGADGAFALSDGHAVEQPAFPVQAVDTVGAGDAFVAGYLAELDAGASLTERLRTAAVCGAIACTAPGDWEAAPDRSAIARLLGEGDPVQR